MKINGLSPSTPPGTSSRIGSKPATELAGRSAMPPGEAVHLSSASAEFSAQSPVNSARVQEIRQAISEGRFQINSGAIADRLLESARELVLSRRGT